MIKLSVEGIYTDSTIGDNVIHTNLNKQCSTHIKDCR